MADGISQFQLTYEISPIALNNGVAGPGGMTPIISLLQPNDFPSGLTGQSSGNIGFNDFVAHFGPVEGSTLIENAVGEYPFANQFVAANAIIVQPLHVSLMMISPAPADGGYPSKLVAFTTLQQTLAKHNIQGGTYTVATPSFYWTNSLLLAIRDVSERTEGGQVQIRWQWDFVQPLLTQAAAATAQSSLMNKISSGTQITGDPPSNSGLTINETNPASLASPGVIPAASGTGSTQVSGPPPTGAGGGYGGNLSGVRGGAYASTYTGGYNA